MHSVPFVSATYVWRIFASIFVSSAYQLYMYVWRISRINGVCATYVLRTFRYFVAFKRILKLLYKCFRFSEVMDQMFLTVRSAVQGSFRATLGVASFFVHVVLRP